MSANQSGGNTSNKAVAFLSILLIISIFALVMTSFIVVRDAARDSAYLQAAGEMRVLNGQITSASLDSTEGEAQAFDDLEQARSAFEESMAMYLVGEPPRVPPLKELESMRAEVDTLNKLWVETNSAAQTIISSRERILFLHDVAKTLNESIPELQQEYNFVVEILIDSGASADQVALAERQLWLAEKIARNVDQMLVGGEGAKDAADQFNLDASTFGSVLAGMLDGNVALRISQVKDAEARASLLQISELYDFVNNSVDRIFEASPDLLNSRQAAENILQNSAKLQAQNGSITNSVSSLDDERPVTVLAIVIAGLALVLVLAGFGVVSSMNTNVRLRQEEQANERNQMAILRLLDELSDLADGDLTAKATVTEDFTGAIADSVNFTIDQLIILVSNINRTAVEVSQSAQETQSTALNLADAAEHQAQEIAGASAAINEMAVTIDQVSANASESANVAERSVHIAGDGAKVVQNTIRGMDTIREQIQETSKRIKRLGESSQEIGDIVSLINDIADQTNILSLNAAIQASMAGDAGRGFAVVADEVQRLAERSSAATKQIETLVKTIQADTNEAVTSMEATTTEVVKGGQLAQDAGVALEEIEDVSQNLAELIQNISNAARQQAASAGHISNTMTVIQEITTQTSQGTTATAKSVGTLAEMATDLRGSVAGFKLPEDGVDDSALIQTGQFAAINMQEEGLAESGDGQEDVSETNPSEHSSDDFDTGAETMVYENSVDQGTDELNVDEEPEMNSLNELEALDSDADIDDDFNFDEATEEQERSTAEKFSNQATGSFELDIGLDEAVGADIEQALEADSISLEDEFDDFGDDFDLEFEDDDK